MDMIEKVARALRECTKRNKGRFRGNDENGWREYVDDAKFVIEAIREPDGRMLEAAARLDLAPPAQLGGAEYWRAMIGAAIDND